MLWCIFLYYVVHVVILEDLSGLRLLTYHQKYWGLTSMATPVFQQEIWFTKGGYIIYLLFNILRIVFTSVLLISVNTKYNKKYYMWCSLGKLSLKNNNTKNTKPWHTIANGYANGTVPISILIRFLGGNGYTPVTFQLFNAIL